MYSLGLVTKEDGMIQDVKMGGPAQKAGVTPMTKIAGVNGRKYNPQVLRDAVTLSANSVAPIELMVEDGEFYKTFRIDYHGGDRFPHLVRDESQPDLLSAITAPHVK